MTNSSLGANRQLRMASTALLREEYGRILSCQAGGYELTHIDVPWYLGT